MRCLQCGRELKESNKYCPGCGARIEYHQVQMRETNNYKNENKKKIGFKTGLLIGIILVCLLVAGFEISTNWVEKKNQQSIENYPNTVAKQEREEQKFEGDGFATPEEAVKVYLDAMKQGDVKKMLSTFAIETYVKNYNMDKGVNRTGVYSMFDMGPMFRNTDAYTSHMVPVFRNTDTYTETLNAYVRQELLISYLIEQYFYLAGMGDVYWNSISISEDDQYKSAEEFLDELMDLEWMEKLSTLEYEKIVSGEDIKQVLPESYYSDGKTIEEFKATLIDEQRADDIASCAVKVKFNNKNFYFCPDAVCYGGKWYLLNHVGVSVQYLAENFLSGGLYEIEE